MPSFQLMLDLILKLKHNAQSNPRIKSPTVPHSAVMHMVITDVIVVVNWHIVNTDVINIVSWHMVIIDVINGY